MLEWLKTILGEAYTEDIEKKVSEEIGKGFVARADFNAANETKTSLEKQLKERDKQLETLKKVDAEGLQAKIVELQEENKTTEATFKGQMAELRRDSALDMALTTGKARDTKAVKALLNMEEIKFDGDKLLGLDNQLDLLKKEKSFLFDLVETDESTVKVDSGGEHGAGATEVDTFIASARKAAGLPENELPSKE